MTKQLRQRWGRGLSRLDAAEYLGVSTPTFDRLVGEGTMPSPRRIGSRKVWDAREIDAAFEDLPRDGSTPGRPAPEDGPQPIKW